VIEQLGFFEVVSAIFALKPNHDCLSFKVALISTERMGGSVLQLAGVNLIWGLRLGDYHRPQE
jgi:hypothetical protein